jgi:hypothetical protein
MTLTTTANRKAYTASAGQTVFPYDFLILAASDVRVYLDSVLVPASGYTVSGIGLGSGGNVTFLIPCVGGEAVLLYRQTELTQQVNLVEGDKLPAEPVELNVFDRFIAVAQDLAETLLRAIKVPRTSANATTEMFLPDPALTSNWNKALKIKADGTGVDTYTVLSTDIASPITTKGDLIRGSASGIPERKGVGSEGDVLTSRGGQIEWEAPRVAVLADSAFAVVGTDASVAEKVLATVTVPANVLTDGATCRFRATGRVAANGNTKTVRVRVNGLGGTTLVDSGPLTTALASWHLVAEGVWQSNAWSFTGWFLLNTAGGVGMSPVSVHRVGEGSFFHVATVAITLDVTGQNGSLSANDVTMNSYAFTLSP